MVLNLKLDLLHLGSFGIDHPRFSDKEKKSYPSDSTASRNWESGKSKPRIRQRRSPSEGLFSPDTRELIPDSLRGLSNDVLNVWFKRLAHTGVIVYNASPLCFPSLLLSRRSQRVLSIPQISHFHNECFWFLFLSGQRPAQHLRNYFTIACIYVNRHIATLYSCCLGIGFVTAY